MLVKAWDVSAHTCSTKVCHLDDFDGQLLPSLLGLASMYCAERASVITTREQAMIVGNKLRSSRGRHTFRVGSWGPQGWPRRDPRSWTWCRLYCKQHDNVCKSDSKLGGEGGSVRRTEQGSNNNHSQTNRAQKEDQAAFGRHWDCIPRGTHVTWKGGDDHRNLS
jgi:hypothetical protein